MNLSDHAHCTMKKYLQYNAAQFSKQASDVGERRRALPTDAHQNGCTGVILDLSGKSIPTGGSGGNGGGNATVAMVTGPKWDSEQEAALDLSSCKKPLVLNDVAQSEALDLSKPSLSFSSSPSAKPVSNANLSYTSSNQPYTSSNQAYRSSNSPHVSVSLPPPLQSVPKNTSAVHCSLLQAALNSSQSTSALHANFLSSNQSAIGLDARARGFNGGVGLLDGVRSIKPFTSLASRPVGISVPHITGHHASVAVVQGIHKPMAITAPQPHVTVTSSKDQQISHSPSSFSQSNGRNNGPPFKINKSPCSSPPYQNHLLNMPRQQHNGLKPIQFGKGLETIAERFLLQNRDGRNHIADRSNFNQSDRAVGFSCAQCPKVFKTKAALKLHSTVHKTSEERQYECQICKRRFLHRHHLVVHQRKHSGEKPFQCNACSKTFMAIFLLHKHLRKHVRETGRSREISVDQLQQLHIKKMTSDGPSDIGTVGIVSKIPEESLVILSDEDELSGQNSAELSFDKNRSDKDSEIRSVIQVPIEASVEPVNNSLDERNVPCELSRNQSTVAESDIVNRPFPKSEHLVEINKSPEEEEKCEAKSENFKSDVLKNENEAEKCVEKIELTERERAPFPVCTEGEELELDFVTGELKVVPKNQVLVDDHCEMSQDENNSIEIFTGSSGCNDIPASDSTDTKYVDIGIECQKIDCDVELEPKLLISIDAETSKPGTDSENLIISKKCDEAECIQGNRVNVIQTEVQNVQSDACLKDVSTSEAGVHSGSNKRNSTDTIEFAEDGIVKKTKVDVEESSTVILEHSPTDSVAKESVPRMEIVLKENAGVKQEELFINTNTVPIQAVKGKNRKGKRAKCEICSRTFSSNHHLVLHMSVHKRTPNATVQNMLKAKNYPVKPPVYTKTNINCHVCKKVFKFQKSLNSHMRVHSVKLAEQRRLSKAFRDFVTEIVPPSSGNISFDGNESSSLKDIESQGESSCSELYEQSNAIIDSNLSVDQVESCKFDSSDREPPIQCIIGEDNVKRYVCHACDNTYTTKQKLKMHALIHKDNCYLCDMCGKSFFREVTLEKHIMTHLLPRPHVCTVCKKSFIHRSSLMRHRSVHAAPSTPTSKQQEADINFEMKMLDTYTLLRQERLQQQQGVNKILPLSIESLQQKNDVLDLSLRVKMDDPYSSMPPVLSPVQKTEVQSLSTSSCANLSPPLITCETVQSKCKDSVEVSPVKSSTQTAMSSLDLKDNTPLGSESPVKMSRLEPNATLIVPKTEQIKDSDVPLLKKSRKTRVYQTSCRECKQMFPNVMSLKSHMSVHNMVETHLYECHICHHRFTQSCSLLRHLKTSCQENRLKCDPCGKTFHRRNTFEQHLKMHQVGTPSLDGSFYDKRRDEAEIKEERESDIENNNTSKIKQETSVKVETPAMESNEMKLAEISESNNAVYDHLRSIPYHEKEKFDNETESDARTYLYSEGEIRTRDLSDFSETELSPPSSPKNIVPPKTESPTPMTLNLLSAVCSDIRNAEKEHELRRRELEERQKELETIEILANLKRGLLQSQSPSVAGKAPNNDSKAEARKQPNAVSESSKVVHSSPKSSKTSITKPSEDSNNPPTMAKPSTSVSLHMIASIASNLPLPVVDSKPLNTSQNPQKRIPTVALEAAAETEKSSKDAGGKIPQPGRVPKPEVNKVLDPVALYEMNHFLFRDLHKLSTMEGPNIRERLSQLMKAQIPLSLSQGSTTSQVISAASKTSTQSSIAPIREDAAKTLTHSTASSVFSPPGKSSVRPGTSCSFAGGSRPEAENSPQDLSMKKPGSLLDKHPTKSLPIPVSLRDRSIPAESPLSPPPLVPVYNCDQCGMLLYNKNALFLHVQEHEFAKNPSLLKIPPRDMLPVSYADVLKRETPTELKVGPNIATQKPPPSCPPRKQPPSTLDFSSTNQQPSPKSLPAKAVACLKQELPSPTTSSTDMSESLSSPSTPSVSTAPTDLIRKELRCKIYSRRRSQGLEDLTVEFKSPEPSEMTDEERLKLNYRRECNRQAAQRSRLRKKDLVDSLLERLGEKPKNNDKDTAESPKGKHISALSTT